MILMTHVDHRLSNLVVADEIKNRVNRVIIESIQKEKLKSHGMENRRKMLLAGPPETGKILDNDVDEMRRVLNSFLQFIEQDDSSSLIITATNNPRLLDQALFR